MTELIPLDLVVLNDNIEYVPRSIISRQVQDKFDISSRKREETSLKDPESFSARISPNSLLYVHAGRLVSHRNFDRLLEISDKRPDLKWIVEFDPYSEVEDFTSPERYEQYRALPHITEMPDSLLAARLKEEKICAHLRGSLNFLMYLTQERSNPLTKYLELVYEQRCS